MEIQPPPPNPVIERLREPGARNLVVAITIFGVTGLILALAIFLSWTHALIALIAACLALGVVTILWRLGIHNQRHGFLLSLSLVCLAGTLVPLTYGMAAFLRQHRNYVGEPRVSTAPAPAPPVAGLPLLTAKFPKPEFDPAKDPYVKVLQDAKVRVGQQTYLIESGETFPLIESKDGEVIFKAGDQSISLSANEAQVVSPIPPAPTDEEKKPVETPAQIAARTAKTRAAQERAIKMYPALSIKDSRENKAFLAAYDRMKETNPTFLDDPEWPLQLAKALAESRGWIREDQARR